MNIMFDSLGDMNFKFITPHLAINLRWMFPERQMWMNLLVLTGIPIVEKIREQFSS